MGSTIMLNIRLKIPKQNNNAATLISLIFFCDSMTIMVRILTIVPKMEQISAPTNAILDQVSLIMIIEPFLAESIIMEQIKLTLFLVIPPFLIISFF